MEPSQIFKILAEGALYDVFKLLVAPLLASVAGVIAIRIITDRLRGAKDIIAFGGCAFVVFASLFYFLGTNRQMPQLVGGIEEAITAPAAENKGTLAIITMSVINSGGMQTIIKDWQVEASLNGVNYPGIFLPMPDRVVLRVPDFGPSSPEFITYHREDDMLIKSIVPLQGGALVSGTLYVLFKDIDPAIFKDGADITVSYQDALSHNYAATIKTTARFDPIGVPPGMHTEMVCRMPPKGS